MKRKQRRLLSLLLAFCMVLSLMPHTIYAYDGDGENFEGSSEIAINCHVSGGNPTELGSIFFKYVDDEEFCEVEVEEGQFLPITLVESSIIIKIVPNEEDGYFVDAVRGVCLHGGEQEIKLDDDEFAEIISEDGYQFDDLDIDNAYELEFGFSDGDSDGIEDEHSNCYIEFRNGDKGYTEYKLNDDDWDDVPLEGIEFYEIEDGDVLYIRTTPSKDAEIDSYGTSVFINGTQETIDVDELLSEDGYAITYEEGNSYCICIEFRDNSGGDTPNPNPGDDGDLVYNRPEYNGNRTEVSYEIVGDASFAINDSDIYAASFDLSGNVTFTYDETKEGVDFYLPIIFIERYTSIKIAGYMRKESGEGYEATPAFNNDYSTFIPTTRDELLKAFYRQNNVTVINNVPLADFYKITCERVSIIDEVNDYNEKVEKGEIIYNEAEDPARFTVIGNFLWTTGGTNNEAFINVINPQSGRIDVSLDGEEFFKYDELNFDDIDENTVVYIRIENNEVDFCEPTGIIVALDGEDIIEFVQDEEDERIYYAEVACFEELEQIRIELQANGEDESLADCIDGGRIELVSAKIDGVTYYYNYMKPEDDENINHEVPEDEGNSNDWIVPNTAIDWFEDGMGNGSAVFPYGTELTVRLIPDCGKQLVAFGVNGGKFTSGEEVSTYTFTVERGNFHLCANFDDVSDVVLFEKTETSTVSNIEYFVEGAPVDSGTLVMKVEEAGSEVDGAIAAIDIDLSNVIYGTKVNDDPLDESGELMIKDEWTTSVTELDNDSVATLTVEIPTLEEGVKYDVIREHTYFVDGEEEVVSDRIEAVNNDDGTISFESDKFSKFTVVEDVHIYKDVLVSKATTSKNGLIETRCINEGCNKVKTSKVIYMPKSITIAKTDYPYTGCTLKPAVTVKDSKGTKISASNYTVAYTNNKSVGKATITVTFKGNYSGTLKTTFKIVPKKNNISSVSNGAKGITIKWTKNTTAAAYYVYRSANGGAYKNIATVKNPASGTTVSYTDNTATGNGTKYQYKIVPYKTISNVKFTGPESDVKTIYRLSKPSITSVKNNVKGKVEVVWSKNSKATGFEIKYVTGKTTKTIKVTSGTAVKKVIASLAKGKTYSFSVRTYKVVSKSTFYSDWSVVKKIKLTK